MLFEFTDGLEGDQLGGCVVIITIICPWMGEKANDRNTCHTMSIIITSKEQNTHDDTLLLTLLEAFQQQKKNLSALYIAPLSPKKESGIYFLS